jgi:hypothetical protein
MADLNEVIQRRRHFVTIVVRSTCGVLIGAGVVGALAVAGRAILLAGWAGVRAVLSEYSSVGYLSLSAACVVVGLLLAAVDERLVRWLVPVIHPACPNCGYPLGKTHSQSCSECGFALERNDDGGQDRGEDPASSPTDHSPGAA